MGLEQSNEIPQRWRIPALILWFLIAAAFLAVYIADLPLSFNQTSSPCQGSDCHYQAISPAETEILAEIGLSTSFYATYIMGITVVAVVVYAGLALLILYRQSHQLIGLVVSLTIVVMPAVMITNFDVVSVAYPAWQVPISLLFILGQFLIILFFLIFPNGRLMPRWSALILVVELTAATSAILRTDIGLGAVTPFSAIMFFIVLVATVFVVIVRYRRIFTPLERQQAKWALVGFMGMFLGVISWMLTFEVLEVSSGRPQLLLMMGGWTIINFLTLLLPVGLAISILRYRLWDIDIVIRRTLVFGTLTIILVLIYFGSIIVLQNVFSAVSGQLSPVAIVTSTLAIAALFQPLRRRIQAIIDHRFYRSKYDAAQTLEQFAVTTRDEVDLDRLTAELLATVQQTMQPERLSLWLKEQVRHKPQS
jgi:hypothetical protein